MKSSCILRAIVSLALSSCASHTPQAPQVFREQALLSDASPEVELLSPETSHELFYLHRKLVEIESIIGNEYDIGEWLASYLTSKNLTVEKQEVSPRRFNILAYPGTSNKTDILVTSHIDTVPPYIPYSTNTSNTTLWGRGTVDAKACIAAQTTAALSLLSANSTHPLPPTALSLLFVVGEETGGDGMRHFSAHKPSDYRAVIFGEPTEGKLASGHKGMLSFTLKLRGKAAHSGYPWLGLSANGVLVRALAALQALEARLPGSEQFGNTTANVGRVEGGVAANVVAETASASVAVRIGAGTPDVVWGMVAEALWDLRQETIGAGGDFRLERVGRAYGPVFVDHDVEGFESMTVNYGTDIPNLKGRHKRYLYGPGSILVAHSDHEHLSKRELERAVKDYERLILAALKED